ncbi:hypothetical protein J3R30DRAFT_1677685 [Lentinula aciculospora]|uniref:Zinc-finger domain-containing protein n=1 Tax=Lentinula aciculospora TaxID=153920 RepID=A0A9W8ZVL5_9AGAR|nr:hypothetical protein J3R30DRAFT_1677685 [Lentinula aciculospora]
MSTASSSSTPASAARRFRQVYVEIPPSPLHTSRRPSIPSLSTPLSYRSNHRENTHLQHSINKDVTLPLQKRKGEAFSVRWTAKKPRIEHTHAGNISQVADTESLIACHHCRLKCPTSEIVQCNFLSQNSSIPVARLCKTKYCRNCLKKRYNEEVIGTNNGQKENGHAEAAYIFECPKCRGQCSCWRCRHRATIKSTAAVHKTKALPKQVHLTTKDAGTEAASKGKRKAFQSGVAPKVAWSAILTALSVKDAEDRIFIREFILRFYDMHGMSVTKPQLEELEFIGGHHDLTDDGDEDSENVYVDWVSEACVKSLVLSLVGVLAAEEDSSATLVMKNAMKDIRNSGANLNKIWAVLSSLRAALGRPEVYGSTSSAEEDGDDESSEDRIILDYPDPSPPPANYNIRSTRSNLTEVLHVVHSAQMIPVILGLIEIVLESHAIRVELDNGRKEGKERLRESRELIKLENESWKNSEASQESDISQITLNRQAHQSRVQVIENAAKVISTSFLPRFSPLGFDPEGRVYWVLTPGVYDREYALDHVVSRTPNASKRLRNRRQRRQREEADSKALREWSWFLAVWGNKPCASGTSHGDEPQWWGFWDPAEIRKLADWISITNGLQITYSSTGGAAHSREQLKTLVKGIAEYAALLEWRAQGEDD